METCLLLLKDRVYQTGMKTRQTDKQTSSTKTASESSILPYQPSLFGIAEIYQLCWLAIEIFLTQTSWKGLSPHLKTLQECARTTELADAAHRLLGSAQLSSELQLIFLAFHRPFAPTAWRSEETTKELEQSKTFLLLQQPPVAQKRRHICSAIFLPLPLTVPSKCKSNVSAEEWDRELQDICQIQPLMHAFPVRAASSLKILENITGIFDCNCILKHVFWCKPEELNKVQVSSTNDDSKTKKLCRYHIWAGQKSYL